MATFETGTGTLENTAVSTSSPLSDSGKGIIESSIVEAFAACAETQRLLALPYLTGDQVPIIYPVSRSMLDKMRMERTGPEFVQVKEKGAVAYTHQAIRTWLNRHRQRVL